MKIFENTAPVLWEHGLPAIPLRGKGAFTVGWNRYCVELPDAATRAEWLGAYPDANVGLPLGPASGLCMLDVDTDDADVQKAIIDVLPFSPWARIGKKGMALAYRFTDLANFKLKSDDGMVCELLGLGNQLVLPPSIHPDTGKPYTANVELWQVLDELQPLPIDIEEQLRRAITVAGIELKGRTTVSASSRGAGSSGQKSRFHRWLADKLKKAKAEVSGTPEGDRSNSLIREASLLARHVAAAGEEWAFYADELAGVALQIGLEPHEIAGTLARAWAYGSEDPTRWIQLAQEWVYVSGVDHFRHLGTGVELTQQAFRTQFGSVNPESEMSITAFLTRNDYIEKVQNVAFHPARPLGTYEENGLRWLNTYRPSAVVAVEGDATRFQKFVEYLVPDDFERGHLLKFMAHLVQKPGEKLAHAVILGSQEHGVGKSTLLDILFEVLGTHNCRKASSEELDSQYNSYVQNALLVLVEEINLGAGGRRVYNKLKDLITGSTVPMRRMYKDWDNVPNMANFVFLTNLQRPILLEKEDRRFFVVSSPAKPRDPDYYADFSRWWRNNLGVIRYFLEQVDVSGFDPFAPPPMTEAKAELIKGSEAPVVQELREMVDEHRPPFHLDIVTFQQIAEAVRTRLHNATRNQIEDALRDIDAVSLGQHKMGKATSLRARILGLTERPSLWAVRNVDFWRATSQKENVEEYLADEARLADFPQLPQGFAYAPASLLPRVADRPKHDSDAGLLALLLRLRERSREEERVE